ncbi:hypothetical protein FHETE_10915 [Fusarium heterosporum]|uniref:Uncharacterized protein n=1 Tax=Fusarium heterosporum TaxID=42747 RepID=A0A8H5SS56_FUSHE|nr:hypothetical protein FHETE_10915 [Fusarium heterosporum]
MSKWSNPESRPARVAPYARMSISSTRPGQPVVGQQPVSELETDCIELLAEIEDFFQSEEQRLFVQDVDNTNPMNSPNLGEAPSSQDGSVGTDDLVSDLLQEMSDEIESANRKLDLLTGDNRALRSQIEQLKQERDEKKEVEGRVHQLERILHKYWRNKDLPSPEIKRHIEKLQRSLEEAEGKVQKEMGNVELQVQYNMKERAEGRKQLKLANSQISKLGRDLELAKLRLQKEAKKNRDHLALPGVAKQLEVEQQLLLANSEIQMLKARLNEQQTDVNQESGS